MATTTGGLLLIAVSQMVFSGVMDASTFQVEYSQSEPCF